MKVPLSDNFDPVGVFADGAQIAEWNNNNLPADSVSSQNGMILSYTERWALIIDPQLQGIRWLKEQYKDNLSVLKYSDKGWKNEMFTGIETGKTIIFENLEESIDATITPVIGRNYIKRGGSKVLKIGDRELTVHPEFVLFLQTKLSNPHQPPEIQAECTLINFSVTEEGLEDQLLALIVRMEREDLANLKEELVKAQRNFNIQLANLENNLLTQLKNAEGDILENIGLIENLEESKKISDDIKTKVAEGMKTEENIKIFSEK